jgi:hypothetical protein
MFAIVAVTLKRTKNGKLFYSKAIVALLTSRMKTLNGYIKKVYSASIFALFCAQLLITEVVVKLLVNTKKRNDRILNQFTVIH